MFCIRSPYVALDSLCGIVFSAILRTEECPDFNLNTAEHRCIKCISPFFALTMSPFLCPVCRQRKKCLSKHLAWSASCSEAFLALSPKAESNAVVGSQPGVVGFTEPCSDRMKNDSVSTCGPFGFPSSFDDTDSTLSAGFNDMLEDGFGNYHAEGDNEREMGGQQNMDTQRPRTRKR